MDLQQVSVQKGVEAGWVDRQEFSVSWENGKNCLNAEQLMPGRQGLILVFQQPLKSRNQIVVELNVDAVGKSGEVVLLLKGKKLFKI